MGETDEPERGGSQEHREDGQSHRGFETAKPEVSPAGKESTCNAGDPSMIPGLGRSPGKWMLPTPVFLGFLDGSDGKESACNVGDLGSIPGLGKSPGRGHGNSFQYSSLENPLGQRSLVGCSSWSCKESDMTE